LLYGVLSGVVALKGLAATPQARLGGMAIAPTRNLFGVCGTVEVLCQVGHDTGLRRRSELALELGSLGIRFAQAATRHSGGRPASVA